MTDGTTSQSHHSRDIKTGGAIRLMVGTIGIEIDSEMMHGVRMGYRAEVAGRRRIGSISDDGRLAVRDRTLLDDLRFTTLTMSGRRVDSANHMKH